MQDTKPDVREYLERVGVSNLKTLVSTNWRGKRYRFVPEIELTIDLDKEKRGAHMSRLIESISECIEEETHSTHGSLEELGRNVLVRLREKHSYGRGGITISTKLVMERKTPVTKKKTMEAHDVKVSVYNDNNIYRKSLEVQVVGNTLCPHAMKKTGGRSHIQRAVGMLRIDTSYGKEIALEDMIDVVEGSFPSPVYTLLKTEDERDVVNRMFQKPRFVEDVTREILDKAGRRFKGCGIRVRTVSEESIHRHDVVAEGSCFS